MSARIDDLLDFYDGLDCWFGNEAQAASDADSVFAELDEGTFHPNMYYTFTIPKRSGGERQISAPNEELMRKQRLVLEMIQAEEPKGSDAAHAYYAGRSIKTMAQAHVRKRWVIRLDLSDFFPNLSSEMVCRAMRLRGMSHRLIRAVQKWCFLKNGLPQGAPTSPVLSNIATGFLLDRRLLGLCRAWHRQPGHRTQYIRYERIRYTRYADDLCFSSDYRHLPKMIPALRHIIEDAGFELNNEKIRVMHRSSRQLVCSVSLNQHIGKPRDWRMRLRGMLHRIIADIEHGRSRLGHRLVPCGTGTVMVPIPFDHLVGCVTHVEFLNANQARGLRQLLNRLLALHEDYHVESERGRAAGHPAPGLGRPLSHRRDDAQTVGIGVGDPTRSTSNNDAQYRYPAPWVPGSDPWAAGLDLRDRETADARQGEATENPRPSQRT